MRLYRYNAGPAPAYVVAESLARARTLLWQAHNREDLDEENVHAVPPAERVVVNWWAANWNPEDFRDTLDEAAALLSAQAHDEEEEMPSLLLDIPASLLVRLVNPEEVFSTDLDHVLPELEAL